MTVSDQGYHLSTIIAMRPCYLSYPRRTAPCLSLRILLGAVWVCRYWPHGVCFVSAQADDVPLLWSSTGGGWRAMFADIGYANVFQQAGLFTENATRFSSIATVSGGSWFSTQLFYSEPFYRQTAMAESPNDLEQFVLDWMETYYNISSDIDEEIRAECDTSELEESTFYDPDRDFASLWQEVCELLHTFNFDWAFFIQTMLDAGATNFGDASFVDTVASPDNRVTPLQQTDLLVLAALVPNSRLRNTSKAIYLGYTNGTGDDTLFSTVLSASYVVQDTGSQFWYGSEDRTDQLQTYVGDTLSRHSWSHWEAFYLFPSPQGNFEIDNSRSATVNGDFETPFGGPNTTTVTQIASCSSAAAGNASPLGPSVYTQTLSIPRFQISEKKTKTVWRILAGLAAGLGAGFFFYVLIVRVLIKYKSNCCDENTYRNVGTCSSIAGFIGIGLLTFGLYGFGSIFVPTFYDNTVDEIYQDPQFDNFAVCSQWPNSCGERDGVFIDGWFIDNPALVVNVGHQQRKGTLHDTKPIKVILTNTNEAWNTTFNYVQILQYFSADFNEDVAPGEFLWAPTYYAPYRSPQIFAEALDERGLDALLEPIPDSNMTTAVLRGTTIDNPSFGVTKGQVVEILLLNLNEDITTFVVGASVVKDLTQPLANMTAHIAASAELVQRVRDFADSSSSS